MVDETGPGEELEAEGEEPEPIEGAEELPDEVRDGDVAPEEDE